MKKTVLVILVSFFFVIKVEACTPVDTSICLGDCAQLFFGGGTTYSWVPSTGLSSTTGCCPAACPSTTVTYTVGNDAFDTAVITVTVHPRPVITINPPNPYVCVGQCMTITASGGSSYQWNTGSTMATATVCGGSYCVVAFDAIGCSDTTCFLVGVNPLPVVNVNPPISICQGYAVQLSASGGIFCSWTPQTPCSAGNVCNPVCSPTVTTTFTVTVTDANGCTNSATTIIVVNPNPIVITCPDTTICAGGCANLCASGGAFYSWTPAYCLSSTNSSNPTFCCSNTTTYTVIVIDLNGCVGVGTTTVTVMPLPCSIGIEKPDEINGIQFYPNPLTNSFILILPQALVNSNLNLVIYDMLGKELIRRKLIRDRMEIEKGNLVSGVYFVKVGAEKKNMFAN